ncbi:MAG TPA: VCBS repeat-containing protein, partial [Planctomycetota bacterium]|nr:VCBS repeat-containing protein [Planctomycetota bacterium]
FGCGQIGCANVVRSVGILDGDGQGGLTAASAQTCPGATSQLPIAVADLNGDGRPEILVGAVDAIWRFANDGAGAIVAPPARFGVGSLPSGVAVADVDGDGFLDAVASVVVDDLVTVLAGDGGSGFLAPPTIAVGLDPIDVALADWDGDGRLDAAVANVTAGSVSFLAGDGEGGFLATPLAVVALASPQDLAVADFDGDGRADVVAARGSAGNAAVSLVVHVGGALAISSTTAIPAPAFVASVAVADWNLDGKIDVATANGPGDSVSLLLGDGAGGLAAPVSFAGVDLVSAVAAGDLDADGRPDLVACSLAGKSVATFRGNGAGGFAPPDESVVAESVAGPYSVATGDVNGDGRLDVVAAAHGPSAVSVFAGDGAGGLAAAVAFPTGGKPQHVAIADLDGDARADLLTTNQGSLDVSWLRNEGAGAFAAPIGFFVDMTPNASGPKVFRSAIGDLDADGRPDVVAVGGYGASPNLVTILRNRLGAAPSTLAYGAGTGGCSGHLGIAASSPPTIGNAAFGIANTNAPPSTLGLALIGDAPDPAGTDLFGLGLDLHVSLLFSTFVFGLTSASDAGGSGFAPAPLPPNPALSGATVFAQGIWVEKPGLACSAAILHLVSTKGLAFTIQ